MNAVIHLLSLLSPSAHATTIEKLGSNQPSIALMWTILKDYTFPHTNVGTHGVAFIAVKIFDFILRTIGGLAVIIILWGAIRIITGGEEGVTEGKKIVLYAVLGLIAALCADAATIYTCQLVWAASGGVAPNCSIF